ncbi:MAG: twin-arginine translocation signal domain-containing protein [Thermoguttaceae bacterium]|jgi:hypothetical protein|nr:twin-arginine translocation signal domain-containing protein [Thermoguttaceae bacterium]
MRFPRQAAANAPECRTLLGRRRFLQTATAAGLGLTILPTGARGGPDAPSNKLNIALIGCWGRGLAHFGAVKPENIVALCDVNGRVTNNDEANALLSKEYRKGWTLEG